MGAGLINLVLSVFPALIIQAGQAPDHAWLMLCLWGVAGGFIHGVGYIPATRIFRIVFDPLAAWLLMLGGLSVMISL